MARGLLGALSVLSLLVRAQADLGFLARSERRGSASAPDWGCGLVGPLPGVDGDGSTTPAMQELIDGLKTSSSLKKVFYWNWNLAPDGPHQNLTEDFIFVPSVWGTALPRSSDPRRGLREAGTSPFLDSSGNPSRAEMAPLLLGMNEPDIQGSCMEGVFGECTSPCSQESIRRGECSTQPNDRGECICSRATGVGFWPVEGCDSLQPLPNLWDSPKCTDVVMDAWNETVQKANSQGFKYLSTPQVAYNIDYARQFIEHACGCNSSGHCTCTDASCGCPVYVAFHFYGSDCKPVSRGEYVSFEKQLQKVASIMEDYPFVEGAIVNEVGMLDAGSHPAAWHHEHGCPKSKELPNGLASFLERLLDIAIETKTKDDRFVVKGFAWFNLDRTGGTYNLRLQRGDGSLSSLGKAYIRSCKRWGERALRSRN